MEQSVMLEVFYIYTVLGGGLGNGGYWALEMWLVPLRNSILNKFKYSHMWLVANSHSLWQQKFLKDYF